MKKRNFGKSHLAATRLGLGLAALGRPGYINLGHAADLAQNYDEPVMEQHTHSVLDVAWQAGIRYFDAARSYGKAEQFLASWLVARRIPLDDVVVGSKWGYAYTANWQITAEKHEVKDHSLPIFQQQIQESYALLGGYLRLYQIHSATLDSGVLENRTVLGELARQREHGLLIGLSLSGIHQAATLRRAMEIEFDGRLLFGSVQATWNLLETSAGAALQEAHEAGMGVIVKESLANGRLTPRNQEEKIRPLQIAAQQLNSPMDAVAISAVLAQPWADIVLSGATTAAQLQSNLQALQVVWNAETAESLAVLAETPTDYWTTRSQLAWN